MATSTLTWATGVGGAISKGNVEFGKPSGYVASGSTYKFTVTCRVTSLTIYFKYYWHTWSQTVYWAIGTDSTASTSFDAMGTFTSGNGNVSGDGGFGDEQTKVLTANVNLAAGTYYLKVTASGGNAGYGKISSNAYIYYDPDTTQYTLTLDANGGTVPSLTEISSGFTRANHPYSLDSGASVPQIPGSTLSLSTSKNYLLEFSYYAHSATGFDADLFPDSLPQIYPDATTSPQRYSWYFSSTSSDMSSCQIRFFNDRTIPNPTHIFIYSIALYEVGSAVSSTTKYVQKNCPYGDLPTPTRAGYVFTGWYTAASGGTRVYSTDTASISDNQTLYAQWVVHRTFDINGMIDGVGIGNTEGYGTFDLYINGQQYVDDGIDYCSGSIPDGTDYWITDIKVTNPEYQYAGATHDLNGTITADTSIFLKFNRKSQGLVSIKDSSGSLQDYSAMIANSSGVFEDYVTLVRRNGVWVME